MQSPDIFKKEVSANLEMLKADVAKLKAQAEQIEAKERSRFARYIEELDANRATIARRLDELQDAGGEARSDIERGLKEAWDRLAIAKKAAEARFH